MERKPLTSGVGKAGMLNKHSEGFGFLHRLRVYLVATLDGNRQHSPRTWEYRPQTGGKVTSQ